MKNALIAIFSKDGTYENAVKNAKKYLDDHYKRLRNVKFKPLFEENK